MSARSRMVPPPQPPFSFLFSHYQQQQRRRQQQQQQQQQQLSACHTVSLPTLQLLLHQQPTPSYDRASRKISLRPEGWEAVIFCACRRELSGPLSQLLKKSVSGSDHAHKVDQYLQLQRNFFLAEVWLLQMVNLSRDLPQDDAAEGKKRRGGEDITHAFTRTHLASLLAEGWAEESVRLQHTLLHELQQRSLGDVGCLLHVCRATTQNC